VQEYLPLLPHIKSPEDLKRFSVAELTCLAKEIRSLIIDTVSHNGGHLASNLGVVELTLALHKVFATPDDKIIWDVGHQCYTHKILTGRQEAFPSIRQRSGIAGFPKTSESPHDCFNTGHASTSISAALGMLTAEKLQAAPNRVVAVIGDGALTGGLSYEALSHAGQMQLPLIVILNDNNMSIGPNVGALSQHLSRLSMKARYQQVRRAIDSFVKNIPCAGNILFKIMLRLKRAVKAVFYTDNFFVDLGFEYVGPIEGHDIPLLIRVITDARNLNKPVVIHVKTQKGKGFRFAEDDPGTYHGVQAFSPEDGISKTPSGKPSGRTFTQAFGKALVAIAERDNRVTAITAAMEGGTGLSAFKKAFPTRFFDVGIAEGHAVTFAAGLAAQGMRPVVALYSTFIQRAVDQVIHDVCLQNLPVTFALDRAGLVAADGETHQGIYDISIFRSVPNMAILAPASERELALMLEWALSDLRCAVHPGPLLIRYPKASCPDDAFEPFALPLEYGRGIWMQRAASLHDRGSRGNVCIAFTGSLYEQVSEAADILAAQGIQADLYNLRFLKPIDERYLADCMSRYSLVVFAEEGRSSGGFAEYAATLALNLDCQVLVLGVQEQFEAQGSRDDLLSCNGLDAKGIAARISAVV